MKRTIKNNITGAIVLLLAVVLFASCLKRRTNETIFDSLAPIVQIPEAGYANFSKTTLSFPSSDLSDTTSFRVNYAATNVAPKDIVVTLGVDTAALNAYNADSTHGTKFTLMPDSLYSFTTTQVTVKAGQNYSDLVQVVFYPSKVSDPTANYMLPISIKDAQGTNISGNFGTIYYHIVGNPLSGNYSWDFTRYQSFDTTITPHSSSFTGRPYILSSLNALSIAAPDGYMLTAVDGQPYSYIVSFDNNNGVISNLSVAFDATATADLAGGGFTIVTAPTLLSYNIVQDPANHYTGSTFRIWFQVINSSGGHRTLIDNFTKQ